MLLIMDNAVANEPVPGSYMLVDCLGGTLLQRFIYRFDFFGKYILFLHRTVPDVSILKRNLYLWGYEKNNSTDGSGTAAGCML